MNRIDWGVRGVQLGALAVILLLWYYVGYANLVSPIFLPRLEEVFEKLVVIIATGAIYEPLRVTVGEVLSAYVLSAFFGLTAGYLIGRSRYVTAALEPLLASIFAIPIIIFLPLFILILGIGPESKTAFGATYAFFPIALNTIAGVSQVDAPLYNGSKDPGSHGPANVPAGHRARRVARDPGRNPYRVHYRFSRYHRKRNDRRPWRPR
jgi:ABC-type nitrate/sulfonate/bicarbonate transport system permease component